VEHLGISYRPFPAALDMKKSHFKVAYSKGIGCEGAVAIAQGISIRGSGMSIKMGAINGSKCVSEEWEKSAVVENIIGYRIANFWQYNVIRVERRG
jgi:hypothetical protein